MKTPDDDKGPLGRACLEHGEPAVKHEAGTHPDWWQVWRYRCGCTTREGPTPQQPGDLITIEDPHGLGTVRGIVESASSSRVTVRPVPFPELYEDDQ